MSSLPAASVAAPPSFQARTASFAVAMACLVLLLVGLLAAVDRGTPAAGQGPLLLAPMMGLDACLFADRPDEAARAPAVAARCRGAEGSAAQVIESTLQALGDRRTSRDGRFEMGYTLNLPLLKFLRRDGVDWTVDHEAVARAVRSVRDSDRPVVLYLFSTHFGSGAPAEAALAEDPDNLLTTADGPLAPDRYYQTAVYPWSFVRTDNGITRMREQVMGALLGGICGLEQSARDRVRGVTLLGELHHMFPRFEDGMGFSGPYAITDYSAASVRGFRMFLEKRFGTVAAFNRNVGGDYAGFDAVEPPSKNIRTTPLGRYEEHIDAYAAGTLPVAGWVYLRGATALQPAWVRIYRNGVLAGRVAARFGRQDVAAAHPEFRTADVGWNFDLDYAAIPPGVHRLDMYVELPAGGLASLGTRRIAVMDRTQATPAPQPMAPLPAAAAPPPGLLSYLDGPAELSSYYFNPLAVQWNAFRAQQVRDYLAHFRSVAARSCMPADRIYSHQILPFVNPGWDASKFAVEQDLDVPPALGLGVSLYGEASYGRSFFDWFGSTGRTAYGVTEFHPLRPMDADALGAVLQRHAAHGARFLSFFAESDGSGPWREGVHNIMSFDAGNPHHGAARLRAAVQGLMH
ncbi:hypothetical protein ACFX58_00125 [Sphingomonas sp. NCPPB 2930]